MFVDFVSIPPYASWYVCNIFSDLYKVPCLWQIHLFLSCSFRCKFARVTLNAISSHPSGSTFGGFALVGSLIWTLGRLIALLVNDFQGSITTINNALYLVGRSFVLYILSIVYYTLFRVWNCATSLANNSSPFSTFSSSFCCMVT